MTDTDKTTGNGKITPADIEAKFRQIQGEVDTVAEDGKQKAAAIGGVVAVLLLVLIFFLGQRSGKRKSTVLEVRRL